MLISVVVPTLLSNTVESPAVILDEDAIITHVVVFTQVNLVPAIIRAHAPPTKRMPSAPLTIATSESVISVVVLGMSDEAPVYTPMPVFVGILIYRLFNDMELEAEPDVICTALVPTELSTHPDIFAVDDGYNTLKLTGVVVVAAASITDDDIVVPAAVFANTAAEPDALPSR